MSTSRLPEIDFESIQRSMDAFTVSMGDFLDSLQFTGARMADTVASIGNANQEAKLMLRYAVYAAADNGMAEAEIARLAKIDRTTVRSWLGKQFKRGDLVEGVAYYSESASNERVIGRFVPRDDRPRARPPVDAAWIDDGGPDGACMVRRDTVKPTKAS